jgi:hypothetical protein
LSIWEEIVSTVDKDSNVGSGPGRLELFFCRVESAISVNFVGAGMDVGTFRAFLQALFAARGKPDTPGDSGCDGFALTNDD